MLCYFYTLLLHNYIRYKLRVTEQNLGSHKTTLKPFPRNATINNNQEFQISSSLSCINIIFLTTNPTKQIYVISKPMYRQSCIVMFSLRRNNFYGHHKNSKYFSPHHVFSRIVSFQHQHNTGFNVHATQNFPSL